MKSALVVVLVCVVLATGAYAQLLGGGITPRSAGMGGTGVGVADDGAAWFQNPAGLGALNLACEEGKQYAADAIGAYMHADDTHAWGITASGWDPARTMGIGAGFVDMEGGKLFGAGFGMDFRQSPLSWGVNISRLDPDAGDTSTVVGLGLMYRFVQPERAPIRAGLVVEDLFNETDNGPFFDLGVAWPATDKLLVAADALDVTDETDAGPFFNAGVEYAFTPEWTGRAGIVDTGDGHDLTLGAGYNFANNWRVDAAWQDADGGTIWSVGAGVGF